MTYLLDVNALIALAFQYHLFHDRVALWIQGQGFPPIATCSITELGFVRVLAQTPVYGLSARQANSLLEAFKKRGSCDSHFLPTIKTPLIFPFGSLHPGKLRMGIFCNLPWQMASHWRR